MFALIQQLLFYSLFVVCPLLIILVLLQGGGGDVSSAFGGGGQLDSTLGIGANRKMAQLTGVLVIYFMLAVVVLSIPAGDQIEVDERTDEAGTIEPSTDDGAEPEDDAPPADDGAEPEDDAPPADDGADDGDGDDDVVPAPDPADEADPPPGE